MNAPSRTLTAPCGTRAIASRDQPVRLLAIGLGIAVLVFVLTAGHVIFLPLLFLPLGLFSLGHRRRRQPGVLSRRDAWSR
jgi:hypothetical protein